MKRFMFVFIFIFLCSSILLTKARAEEPDFSVWYDFAAFKMEDISKTYFEIYFSVPQSELTSKQTEAGPEIGYKASLKLDLIKENKIVVDEEWEKTKTLADSADANLDLLIPDQINLVLAPGIYAMALKVLDKHADRSTVYHDTLSVPEFDSRSLQISDIQFSSVIERSTEEGAFVKNGLLIAPQPSRLFGAHLPILYFYVEVYNLDISEAQKGSFSATYKIFDFENNHIRTFPVQEVAADGNSAPLASMFKVDELPAGTYFLHLEIIDNQNGDLVETESRFFVFQQQITKQEIVYIPQLTAENEKAYYGQVFYHLTDHERKLYKSLTFVGKQEFLIDYWKDHDPTPDTAINEVYLENLRRFDKVNQEYGYGIISGWRTDEGRVFILFGQYDQTFNEPFSKEYAPYKIWTYNYLGDGTPLDSEQMSEHSEPEDIAFVKGGAPYFVFAELNNDGKYYLVHSNVIGEIKNMDWRRQIKKYEGPKLEIMRDNLEFGRQIDGGGDPDED